MSKKEENTGTISEKITERLDAFGRLHAVMLLAIVAIGFLLRLIYLKQPLVHDEAFTYMGFAAQPLSTGLSFYPTPNNHLLNTFLIHIFCALVPNGGVCPPWLIRLPAFISGVLTMPAAYFACRRLYNRNIALVATSLIAVSTPLIEYSVMARGYSLVVLLFLLLIIVADRLLEKPSLVLWALFVLLSALGFYAVPVMLYYFTAVVLWMFASWILKDKPERKPAFIGKLGLSCAATVVLAALMYLPVINKSGLSSITSNDWVKAVPFSDFISGVPTALNSTWSLWNLGFPIVLSVIIAIGFLTSLFVHGKVAKHKVNIVYPALISCLAVMLLSQNLPFARVWLPLLPLYLFSAAAGMYWLGDKGIGYIQEKTKWRIGKPMPLAMALLLIITLLLGGLVIANGEAYQPSDQGPQMRDAEKIAVLLRDELGPDDLVVYNFVPATMLRYYFLLHDVPLKHLYIAPDYIAIYQGIYGPYTASQSPEKVFVIESEGEGYPLDDVLEHVNLEEMEPEANLFHEFPDSKVYVINLNGNG